jgi:biopolymer transport protein ExbB
MILKHIKSFSFLIVALGVISTGAVFLSKMDLMQHIEQAGWIGYTLIFISVISLAAGLERAFFWASCCQPFSDAERRLAKKAIESKDFNSLKCPQNSPFGRSLSIITENKDTPLKGSSIADMAMHRATRELYRFTGLLDNNSAIAPMLGILGTMIGIIQSFAGMSSGTPDTAVMVAGISVAMITTAMGLIVSIFSLLLYNFFSAKAYNTQLELADFMTEIADIIDNDSNAKNN